MGGSDFPRRTARVADILGVAASFLLYSFLAAPVPALNEPHYLAKAKHFWNPAWCAGDFFLESANAHTVYFITLGWLTMWLSLPVVAVVGRVLALSLLAWGWTSLVMSVSTRVDSAASSSDDVINGSNASPAVLSAWIFLAIATVGNWSGEWLVGGVESKVFAYAALFWGWSQLPRGRWYRAAVALGVATALHPVAGVWGVLASVGAAAWLTGTAADWKQTARHVSVAGAVFLLVSLPGLVPALQLVLEPVDPRTRFAGTYIQVFYRLAHHLDPMVFPLRAHLGYALLTVVWLIAWRFGPQSVGWRWLHRITALALLFALAGLAIGYGPRPAQQMPGFEWRMQLLKFYPFRLADAVLPLVVSFLTAAAGSRCLRREWLRYGLIIVLAIGTLMTAWARVRDQRYARSHAAEWQDVCRWVRDHTPKDALVIAPHGQWTFKWYGERPEFVNFKDCPQDAAGIVEWNRRQLVLTKWYHTAFEDNGRYSAGELRQLQQQTQADLLIADELGPIDVLPVYQNATHRVYDLRALP